MKMGVLENLDDKGHQWYNDERERIDKRKDGRAKASAAALSH